MRYFLNKQFVFDRSRRDEGEAAFSYQPINEEEAFKNNSFDRIISRDFMAVNEQERAFYAMLFEPVVELDCMSAELSKEQINRFLPVNNNTNERDYCEVSEDFLFAYLEHLNCKNDNNKYNSLISDLKKLSGFSSVC